MSGYIQFNDNGTADYPSVVAGTTGFSDVEDSGSGLVQIIVGQQFDGTQYTVFQGFVDFDTSALTLLPDTAQVNFYCDLLIASHATTYLIAPFDFGGTVDITDWNDPAALAGLTPCGSISSDDLVAGDGFSIDIDPSALTLGGTSSFILYSSENLSQIEPTTTTADSLVVDGVGDPFPPSITHTGGDPTTPADDPVPLFTLERRDLDGTGTVQLASAQPEEITWTLNQPTEMTFSFAKPSYDEADIPLLGDATTVYEYLAYYDDNLLAKGLMIEPDASGDLGAVTCHCADRLWVMNRRNIDAPRDNLLSNPEFESSFTDWTKVGSFTSSVVTTRKVLGTHAAKFEDINTNADDFYYQQFTPPPNAVGTLLTVSAWRFAELVTGTSALGSRGLFVQVSESGVVKDYNYFPIDAADPYIGVWHEDTCTIWIPPNKTWTVEVRLYAVCGTIYWDAASLVAMDSVGSTSVTGSASAEADIASIASVLVQHVQSAANGKSDLHVGRNCPANGVKLFRQYQYVDHVSFASAVSEFTGRDDGFDISVEITPTTSTFTCHTPKKGTDRHVAVTLTFGDNVANYRYSRPGGSTITRETIMGEGSGPNRAEGEYADASQIGGLILQEVRQAPPESVLNSLLPIATDRVKKRRKPLVLELALTPDAGLINTLEVGDLVTCVVPDGYVQVSGTHRIVQMKLTCKTRVLTVFVNEAD